MFVRTALRVPPAGTPEIADADGHGAILGTLMAIGATFKVTDARGYSLITGDDRPATVFEPGDWMLFNASGVYPVTPVRVSTLKAGDGILGMVGGEEERNLYDAVMVLKYKPQKHGDVYRLVPDPARCYPEPYMFGTIYASPTTCSAWKLT